MALGRTALVIRILSSFLCGAAAGLLIRWFYREKGFFNFTGFSAPTSRDTDPNLLMRFLKNLGRNMRRASLLRSSLRVIYWKLPQASSIGMGPLPTVDSLRS